MLAEGAFFIFLLAPRLKYAKEIFNQPKGFK